ADKSALVQPAIRGKDTLNNIEQITIDNPIAGDYELVVDGAGIQTSGQAFAVAYQFDTARTFTFIYPTVRDAITSGSSQIIKWQTTFHESEVLEYTTNGTDWQTIKVGVEVQKKNETFLV